MSAAVAIGTTDAIRVMVVDDSIVARSLTTRWLQECPDLVVVAACRSGREAVERVVAARPDVVILDVEMPEMGGIEALPILLKARPGAAVLMASSYTTQGAALSLKCLGLGATDFLAKPARDVADAQDYRQELVAKTRALGGISRRRSLGAAALAPAPKPAAPQTPLRVAPARGPVRAIVIGASTGGPQALAGLLRSIGPEVAKVPVLIAQHMPVGFTAALAEHLAAVAHVPVREASDGEEIRKGHVLIAPGGRHLTVATDAGRAVARLNDGPPINFCKPAVDPLFRSAAEVFGPGLLAIVLTGMGSDGATAVPVITRAGGSVIAQDEATSVVWGMPGAAVATGECSAVLPLDDIGPRVMRLIQGGRL